ncbi:MAG: Rrf2 family transcriptional regulator [Zoogloeaceae bacterium]|jgi:Rrf2 family iron-sulfur cluster assembly transcriptional regulator|nr:Rrf2 family transcriptional regulator [Zoogloeaceae bacterium]
MRLTTRGRFAVTAMMELAMRDRHAGRPVSLNSICARHGISLSYMEQLFARLRRGSLVSSMRGPGGGYHLGRPASEISVADIIISVDERMDVTQCNGRGDCHGERRCMTHDLWMNLSRKVEDYLASITLDDLLRRHDETVSDAPIPRRRDKAATPKVSA